MQIPLKGKPQPGDEERARMIVGAARDVLTRYADVNVALRAGYKPFHPTGRIGEEVHYTNYRYARKEQQHIDYQRPGSILYRRAADGMKAVGVMYIALRESTPEQLDAIAPLSIATWHRHVDFCGRPRSLPLGEQFGPNAPFGPQGSIQSEDACKVPRGLWIPVVLGWMTHVYPDEKDVRGGMDMEMGSDTDVLKTNPRPRRLMATRRCRDRRRIRPPRGLEKVADGTATCPEKPYARSSDRGRRPCRETDYAT